MKKIFASIALCGLLALVPAAAYAYAAETMSDQTDNITVKGQVVDNFGEPLPYTGVVVKGTSNGVTTDLDGHFTITVPANSTLQFVALGCTTL